MQHTPKLFIFIGRDNHFFTLRESYLHTYYIGRNPTPIYEVRYTHLKNLSQNYAEAVEKAHEASRNLGIELCIRGSEKEQLDEIKRITAEEAEQRKRLLEEENAKAEQEALERRIRWWNQWVEETLNTLNGKEASPRMVGGAHHNVPLAEVPTSYLQWLVYTSGLCEIEEVTFNKMAFVAQWIRDNLNIPEITESEWVGEVGKKIETIVEIDEVRTFTGTYGYTYFYKLRDEAGNELVWFASRNALQNLAGSQIRIKGTVKSHGDYKGRKQTILTRVKVI